LNTWLPTFYAQAFGFSKVESARLTGLFNTAGIPAAILGGILTKYTSKRKPLIWIPGIVMSLSAFLLFVLRDATLLPVAAVFFGVALFLWISPLSTLAMELPGMTPQRFGMVMGVFFSVSYLGAFFAPTLVGVLRDRQGSFIPGFVLFAIASWSLVICSLQLPETGKSNSAATQ
jgi:sugar phosphate permease